ncbi:lytic transglycosylase domain-containing protein [Salinicola aestuarinus]|uniref:lytic transglycosylase domain-containing protein n=1 Tax=Salinicola aestuarinus TaxID=1949082 RepID=UPI001FDA6B68|nr:transglycosylase SLT domain-containing protein [Salinicola aestuarinus]
MFRALARLTLVAWATAGVWTATMATTESAIARSSPPLQEAPSPALLDALAHAITLQNGASDTFDAQVWLLDMQSRLGRRQPVAFADRQARLALLQRVHAEAARTSLPAELVLALIDVESRFQPGAISSAGAQGLMQVMPFWKAEIGRPEDDLTDPATNLRYGCTILAYYLAQENGDWTRGLARYNGSLGRTIYPEQVMAAWFGRWWVER